MLYVTLRMSLRLGLRQEDGLPPILFNLVLRKVISGFENKVSQRFG